MVFSCFLISALAMSADDIWLDSFVTFSLFTSSSILLSELSSLAVTDSNPYWSSPLHSVFVSLLFVTICLLVLMFYIKIGVTVMHFAHSNFLALYWRQAWIWYGGSSGQVKRTNLWQFISYINSNTSLSRIISCMKKL